MPWRWEDFLAHISFPLPYCLSVSLLVYLENTNYIDCVFLSVFLSQKACMDFSINARPFATYIPPMHKHFKYKVWSIVVSQQFDYLIMLLIVLNTILLMMKVKLRFCTVNCTKPKDTPIVLCSCVCYCVCVKSILLFHMLCFNIYRTTVNMNSIAIRKNQLCNECCCCAHFTPATQRRMHESCSK